MESSRWSALNYLAIFLILFQGVSCDTFYILTATANPCPAPFTWDQCITLQRFATNTSSIDSTVTFILEPGSHTLDSGLSLSNIQNFTMVPHVVGDHSTVNCTTGSPTQSFTLSSVSHILWQGIAFNGCTLTFRTNLHSVTFRDLSFTNSGITVTDVADSVQMTNMDFTNNLYSRIVGMRNSTRIQLRNATFMGQNAIGLTKAAEITVEDSIVQQVSQRSLYITDSDNVNIVQCQFLNNNLGSTKFGAGLYLLGVKLKVNDSIFYNNQAVRGAAIFADTSDITIDGTNFTSNADITHMYSGAVSIRGDHSNLTVMSSIFVANTASYGAAIMCNDFWNMKIVNSSFINNGNSPVWTSQGRNLLITNSTFYNNYGGENGALSDRGTSNYTITDCSFISNRASNGKGGAISKFDTDMTIRRSMFSGNSASQNGGAIYASGTLLAESTNFTNNVAMNHGGAIDAQATDDYIAQIYLINCQIINNTATLASGGALHLNGDNSEIYIDRTQFVGNTADNSGSGGAVHHEGQYTNISVTASSFYDNSATSCGVLDVNNTNHHSVKFTGSTFSSNRATGNSEGGGVICIRSATISLTSCTFTDNHAALNAGVFNVEDSVITIDRCSFINNSADVSGGVAYSNVYPTVYSVRLSTFLNNSAERDGGAFYMGMIHSQVNIERSSFGSNSAKNKGGMIALNGSQLIIDNQTNVYDNTASFGAAISACSSEVIAPNELIITGNSVGCKSYSGNINRYNISDFIRQEFSTTPAIPTAITPPTTTSPPVHHNNNMTKPTATAEQQGSEANKDGQGGVGDGFKIAVAISCVSLVFTVGLCGLVGIFLGIRIFMLTKKRSSGSWSRDNQFLLQEEDET